MFKYLNKCGDDLLIPSSIFISEAAYPGTKEESPILSEGVFAASHYSPFLRSHGTKVSGSVFCLSSHQTNASSKGAVNSQHITRALNLGMSQTFWSFIY